MAQLFDFIQQQEQILAALCSGAPWTDESLHDYRVCLRRLQVTLPLLDLLTPERTLRQNWIGRQLKSSNRARDSAILRDQLRRLCAPDMLVVRASEDKSQHKTVSLTKLKTLVEAMAFSRRRWLAIATSGSVFRLPPSACWPLLRLQYDLYLYRVAQRAASINTPQRAQQARRWHRLRVAIKRLRYLVEWLVTLDIRWQSQLYTLKAWQERLGNISDLAMVEQWLRHKRNLRCQGAKPLLRALQLLQQADQQQAYEQLPALSQCLLHARLDNPICAPMNPSYPI